MATTASKATCGIHRRTWLWPSSAASAPYLSGGCGVSSQGLLARFRLFRNDRRGLARLTRLGLAEEQSERRCCDTGDAHQLEVVEEGDHRGLQVHKAIDRAEDRRAVAAE